MEEGRHTGVDRGEEETHASSFDETILIQIVRFGASTLDGRAQQMYFRGWLLIQAHDNSSKMSKENESMFQVLFIVVWTMSSFYAFACINLQPSLKDFMRV